MRGTCLLTLLALSVFPAADARAQAPSDYSILRDDYSIMVPEKGAKPAKPEPWLAPKYK